MKEELLLGEVERELSVELHKILHEAESSAAQYVSQEVFNHHYERAEKEYGVLRQLLRPYLGKRASVDDISELVAAWENEFGSMDDPEVQAEIDAFVKQANAEVEEHQNARERSRTGQRKRPANVVKWS